VDIGKIHKDLIKYITLSTYFRLFCSTFRQFFDNIILFLSTFALPGQYIYRVNGTGSAKLEDCTRRYMILGNECDLPHPLFLGGIHGEQVCKFTRTIPEV